MSSLRTITLTGRAPVKIDEALWPVVASASADSFGGSDYARHQQALHRGEVDSYRLTARQHTDGRALVYGVLGAAIREWGQPAGGEDWRGGELLEPGADLAAAIRRVGQEGGLPESVVRECIADLPPENL